MIAICPNPFRDKGCELSRRVAALLEENGFETCFCPVFADEGDEVLPQELSFCALSDVAASCTLIVVIGGDGTILHAARQITPHPVPVIGINLGSKGFMANLEPEEYAYYWDLDSQIYRPMIIDAQLTMLIKTDAPAGMGSLTCYTYQGAKYYRIAGGREVEGDWSQAAFCLPRWPAARRPSARWREACPCWA